MSNEAKSDAIAALKSHFKKDAPRDMRKAFAEDSKRFQKHSLTLDDLLFDWSKCGVSGETIKLLAGARRRRACEEKA